jgi:hypothetical protein
LIQVRARSLWLGEMMVLATKQTKLCHETILPQSRRQQDKSALQAETSRRSTTALDFPATSATIQRLPVRHGR